LNALVLLAAAAASVWTPQTSGSDAELRGVAVLDARHAWASGAGGTVLRTQDGERWERLAVPGGEKLDFRDLDAPDSSVVFLMSAGTGDAARIYRSADGGSSWTLVHTNPDAKGFYDAIAFWDAQHGLVLGDPVDGRFVIRTTDDGGATWKPIAAETMPPALEGEGAFAASGTCLIARKGSKQAWFVTGGAASNARVFRTDDGGRTWTAGTTPLRAGKPSAGLFTVAFWDFRHGFAAGGDYKDVKLAALNGIRTSDGARWIRQPIAPSGFFSAVVAVPGSGMDVVGVGPVGSAISHDRGRTWTSWGELPLNAVAFLDANTGWAVGPKGTIVRYARRSP
jgi:photosystem II stability/assembly factor-like uncharacterized protein